MSLLPKDDTHLLDLRQRLRSGQGILRPATSVTGQRTNRHSRDVPLVNASLFVLSIGGYLMNLDFP